jgi:molecular chaperone DnaK
MMAEFYGIDLGTRNTAVEGRGGRLSGEAGSTIPSAVAYDSLSDQIRHGSDAMRLLHGTEAERERWCVATSFKTALDSDAPFVRAGARTKSAAEVLTDYFSALVRQAEAAGLPPLRDAVLSIPVGFSPLSRSRLTKAAEDAGIRVHGLVSESTAAFLQIAHVDAPAVRIAVVDWGAGTLDVSILNVTRTGLGGAVIDETASLGSRLAGDEIDLAIYESMATKARRDGRAIPSRDAVDPAVLRTILSACERTKIALCGEAGHPDVSSVIVGAFSDGKVGSFELSRTELMELSRPARTAAFQVLEESIERAGLVPGQLDRVIFVGGCTRIAGFKEEAQARFGPAAFFPQNPEWTVSGGALKVARREAQYESIQEFGCILDDGWFQSLTTSGQLLAFDGTPHSITVATTESTDTASLVFAERQAGRTAIAATLSVPVVGHLGEPVEIVTTLRRDLTVEIAACSRCGDRARDERRAAYANTRFRFRVGS